MYNKNTGLISHRPIDFRLHKTEAEPCCCSVRLAEIFSAWLCRRKERTHENGKKMKASLLFTGCLSDAVYFPVVMSVPSTIVQSGHKDGSSAARSVGLWVRIPPVDMDVCRL